MGMVLVSAASILIFRKSGWVGTGAVNAEWAVRACAYVCKVILSRSDSRGSGGVG